PLTGAGRVLDGLAQPSRDSFRVAATGRGRRSDAVLAEVAETAGLVVHLYILGDEIQVAVEQGFVRQRKAVALGVVGARHIAAGGTTIRSDALMHAECAGQ